VIYPQIWKSVFKSFYFEMGQGQTAEPKWYKDAQKASTTHEAMEKIKKKLADRLKKDGSQSIKTAEAFYYLGMFLNQN
jgi:hypothetical protein